jgi:hypothetical protein
VGALDFHQAHCGLLQALNFLNVGSGGHNESVMRKAKFADDRVNTGGDSDGGDPRRPCVRGDVTRLGRVRRRVEASNTV